MDRPAGLPPSTMIDLAGRGRARVYDTGPSADGRPTLLLLHGWTSTAALNWYRCLPGLANRYRVVALDQRGHGLGVRSRRPFRLSDCADDAAALVEALALGRVTVVGYSMGGAVAQLVWHRHPDRVDGLVLCATAARFPSPSADRGLHRLGLGLSFALAALPARLRRSGMDLATRNWGGSSWATEEWRYSDPAALIQGGLALSRFDSREWLSLIDVPTAVVITEQDTTVSTSRQRELASLIPGARTFGAAGNHRMVVENARAFLPALLAACDAVTGRRAGTVTTTARP